MAGAERRVSIVEVGATLAVAAVAMGVAGAMFAAYFARPDDLWRGVYHDRNAHLAAAMNFALAVKTADPLWFGRQLLAMNAWGPVHGLVLAVVFLAGGVDHRIAILPSLAGWTMTVAFGAMTARALFADRLLGFFAGALAATWIIASPAFRLLGSDVMLEGLGAGLTAVALWTWQRARDQASVGRWRAFALVLTMLFFEKANYWGLVVGALGLTELLRQQGRWRAWLAEARRRLVEWRPAWPADLCLLACAVASGLVVALLLRGPSTVELFGHRVSLYPPDNLATVAYAFGFARLWLAWRAHRAALRDRLGLAGRSLFYWHIAPLAISFLVPRRLAGFLWFVGPANHAPGSVYDPVGGPLLYGRSFIDAFSAAPWAAGLALALAAVGASQWRRYPPGGQAVFVFALTSALAVAIHPLHQARYMASWISAVWICAGAGGAVLLGAIPSQLGARARMALAMVSILVLAATSLRTPVPASAYAVAVRETSGPSDLDLVRPWMGMVSGVRTLGVATTFGPSDLFTWSLEERCQCKVRLERPWTSTAGTRLDDRRIMLTTLAASKADRWVVIDAPASRYNEPDYGLTYDRLAGVVDAMALQRRYRLWAVAPLSGEGGVARVYALN